MGSTTAKALRFEEFGKPEEVLRLVEEEIPPPGEGEVLVRMERAAIHPSDLGIIGGSYGRLPDLPAVAGREGVGRVEDVGPGVSSGWRDKRVRLPGSIGAWRSRGIAREEDLLEVPRGGSAEQGALAGVNPSTAFRLLEDFVGLEAGDWVVQNAGNSAVGLAVVQLCRARGIRTASLVRREEAIEPLRERGGDLVVLDDREAPKAIRAARGKARMPLGLNSVGGPSVLNLANSVSDGGIVVTFGAMSGEKIRFPTRQLIFNDVRFAGFWMDRWNRERGEEERRALLGRVFDAIAAGELETPVERVYPLDDFADALAHNAAGRFGKVLFGDV